MGIKKAETGKKAEKGGEAIPTAEKVKKAEKGKKAENKNKAGNNNKNKKAESKGKKAENNNENKKEKAHGKNFVLFKNSMKAMKAMKTKRRPPECLDDLGSMRSWAWEPREFAQYCNACARYRPQIGIVQCGACGDTN